MPHPQLDTSIQYQSVRKPLIITQLVHLYHRFTPLPRQRLRVLKREVRKGFSFFVPPRRCRSVGSSLADLSSQAVLLSQLLVFVQRLSLKINCQTSLAEDKQSLIVLPFARSVLGCGDRSTPLTVPEVKNRICFGPLFPYREFVPLAEVVASVAVWQSWRWLVVGCLRKHS